MLYFNANRAEIGESEKKKKNHSTVHFDQTRDREFKKKKEKNYKTTFLHYFYPNRIEIGQGREKKKIRSEFRFYPNRDREHPKKFKKLKKKKHHSNIHAIQTKLR